MLGCGSRGSCGPVLLLLPLARCEGGAGADLDLGNDGGVLGMMKEGSEMRSGDGLGLAE